MIRVLFPNEQVIEYKLLKHTKIGLLVMIEGIDCFIPHTSYTLYEKKED